MAPRIETWQLRGGLYVRRGRTSKGATIVDTFPTHTANAATEFNTGPGLGFTKAWAERGLPEHVYRPLDPVADAFNGNKTTTPGEVITDKIIYGWVDMHSTAVFRNCRVVGNATPPSYAQARPLVKVIDHTPSVDGQRAILDFVHIEPQTKSAAWTACIAPYGWETRRVKAQGTTDILAARSNSAGNGLANVRAWDSWFGPVIQWDPDPVTARTGEYLGTHNDTIQFEGNTGGVNDIIFDGCTLVGRMNPNFGQPSSNPAYWPSPTSMSCITAQENTKDRVGFAFRFCTFYGGAPYEINLGNDGMDTSSIEFTDNWLERPGAPGVPANYPQKGLVLDPVLGTGVGGARIVARNFWLDTGGAVAIQGG